MISDAGVSACLSGASKLSVTRVIIVGLRISVIMKGGGDPDVRFLKEIPCEELKRRGRHEEKTSVRDAYFRTLRV